MAGAGTEHLLGGLVDALGETANLAMLEGSAVTYVAQAPGRHSMRMFTEVGRRVQPHCTAVGKAHAGGAVRRRGARRAGTDPAGTPHPPTVTDVAAWSTAWPRCDERGYAMDEGEQEVGVRCVAVAVPPATSGHAARWPSRSPGPSPG